MCVCKELKKAFFKMEKALGKQSMQILSNCPYHTIQQYHFGLGTWVRNVILTERSALCRFFYSKGITHKDDMSDLLLKLFYIHKRRSRSQRSFVQQ